MRCYHLKGKLLNMFYNLLLNHHAIGQKILRCATSASGDNKKLHILQRRSAKHFMPTFGMTKEELRVKCSRTSMFTEKYFYH